MYRDQVVLRIEALDCALLLESKNCIDLASELTEGPLEDLVVHDGAGLSVDHPVRDGLVPPPELALALRRLDGGRPPERKRQGAPERCRKVNRERKAL